MAKKILIMGVALIMCLGLFAGCGGNKYGAVFLDGGFSYSFKKEFLKATFDNENDVVDVDEWYEKYQNGEINSTQAIIVNSQSVADAIFDNSVTGFDFEKEMLLFCFFTEPSVWQGGYPTYKIVNIEINKTNLKFDIERKGHASSVPAQKQKQSCRVIKMNNLEITVAEFAVISKK